MTSESNLQRVAEEGSVDFAFSFRGHDRFRGSVFRQKGQLGMALSPLFATGRDELRSVDRIGIDQLLLLCDLRLIGPAKLFLFELRANTLGNLRDGFGLAITRQTMTRSTVLQQFCKIQCAIPCVIGMRFEDHTFDLAQ